MKSLVVAFACLLLLAPTASAAALTGTGTSGPAGCPYVTITLDPRNLPHTLMPRIHWDCFDPPDVEGLLRNVVEWATQALP